MLSSQSQRPQFSLSPFVAGCYGKFRIRAAAVFSTSRDTLKIKSLVLHSSEPRPRSAEIPGYTSATVPGDEPAAAERPAAPCAELRVTSRLWEASDFLGHSDVALVCTYLFRDGLSDREFHHPRAQ